MAAWLLARIEFSWKTERVDQGALEQPAMGRGGEESGDTNLYGSPPKLLERDVSERHGGRSLQGVGAAL
jgi:hypothetical protein